MLLGLDLGINRTGWCYGDGASTPRCGCWRFPPCGDDLGALGRAFREAIFSVTGAETRFIAYESPFLDRYRDKVVVLRKTYGLGFWLETEFGGRDGVVVEEVPFGKVKKELAGYAGADKDDMVAAAKRCGVSLPPNANQGMEDAADAFGVWLVLVRHYAKSQLPAWDAKLWGRRVGGLF